MNVKRVAVTMQLFLCNSLRLKDRSLALTKCRGKARITNTLRWCSSFNKRWNVFGTVWLCLRPAFRRRKSSGIIDESNVFPHGDLNRLRKNFDDRRHFARLLSVTRQIKMGYSHPYSTPIAMPSSFTSDVKG